MYQYEFIAVTGERRIVEELKISTGMKNPIVDMPGGATLQGEFLVGSHEHAKAESIILRHKLRTFRRSWYTPTVEELDTSRLLISRGCHWLDDMYEVMNKPDYTGVEACPHCGKGSLETHSPLRGKLSRLKNADLIRMPPGLVIISRQIRDLFDEHHWTGAEFRPVIDAATDQESSEFFQLWMTSTLPPMHSTAPIEHNGTPDACVYCKHYGYMLAKPQPVYANKVLEVAEDWNLSHEWLAPHAVPCPSLICKQRVVKEIMKLKSETNWLPCLLAAC